MSMVIRRVWGKIKKRYLDLVNAKNRSKKEEKVGNVDCGT
jgi:hypothetical protein